MTRRKSVCLNWTLVLLLVVVCPSVYTRPQDVPAVTTNSGAENPSTQTTIRDAPTKTESPLLTESNQHTSPTLESTARDVRSKTPIRDSIEMVAIQLLDKPNSTIESPIISDTRVPPRLKTQVKHKIRTRNEDGEQLENAHPGEAVPVTIEELDIENKVHKAKPESSTSNEGISTWHSLGTGSKDNTPTEPTQSEDKDKKTKPVKSKPKRPQTNKIPKRPIIGSTNKADLVAGGSAINENVLNKIKDTVLSSVQKNKNTSMKPSTSNITVTSTITTEAAVTKKESKTTIIPTVTVTNKTKKKNKNKTKTTSTTTQLPVIDDSALLPTEAKEQEIELEVSTPATTTKKPKRSSTKKKNKTKKRKTSTPKPSTDVALADVKTSNKTKTNKNSKKPTAQTGAITTQIYNYLSREVMPSVGVGMLGLASLVGIAGYFLYPFATPVRRTFEVDKNDDLYRNNAEEYANDGNGQAEEEMLGTVLAGMPAHAKQKLNPYAAQTTHINRYPVKKEQDIRYRYVTPSYNNNYKMHYAQQKTGIAHAAVYSKLPAYGQYETRHSYTTEGKYNYDKSKQQNYTPYSAAPVEPIYAAPQTGPSGMTAYGSDTSNSVVYGVKPSSESDFKPVYPFDGQYPSETTSSSVTYSPTSMYLGSSNNGDSQEDDSKYEEDSSNSEAYNNQFVVGNVPKEISDSATPAVVPEHGPRKLRKRRSVKESLEDLLNENDLYKDVFLSNEIDDYLSSSNKPYRTSPNYYVYTANNVQEISEVPEITLENSATTADSNATKNNFVRSISNFVDTTKEFENDKMTNTNTTNTDDSNTYSTNTEMFNSETFNTEALNSETPNPDMTNSDITNTEQDYVESVSTLPISSSSAPTETELYDEIETTTKAVTSTKDPTPDAKRIASLTTTTTEKIVTVRPTQASTKTKTTTEVTYDNFEIELNASPATEFFLDDFTERPVPVAVPVPDSLVSNTESPDEYVVTSYPSSQDSHFGIYSLLQKVVIFKLKLGLGLLQSTVDVLNKLKSDTANVLHSVHEN